MLYDAINVGDQKAWCGPTVIASITGLTVPAVKARIKKHRGHDGPVKSTTTWDLRTVLWPLGYYLGKCQVTDQPTLAQWLRRPRDMDVAYVVNVTNHWVVVKGRWFCDTYTKGVPVRASKAPHRRKRVREVYRVTKRQVCP